MKRLLAMKIVNLDNFRLGQVQTRYYLALKDFFLVLTKYVLFRHTVH